MSETEQKIKVRRTVRGQVVSDKADKTIVVQVESYIQHPVYKKYIRRSNKFHAHDEGNDCRQGDTVVIEESSPFSKKKTWRLVEIVERAAGA